MNARSATAQERGKLTETYRELVKSTSLEWPAWEYKEVNISIIIIIIFCLKYAKFFGKKKNWKKDFLLKKTS